MLDIDKLVTQISYAVSDHGTYRRDQVKRMLEPLYADVAITQSLKADVADLHCQLAQLRANPICPDCESPLNKGSKVAGHGMSTTCWTCPKCW